MLETVAAANAIPLYLLSALCTVESGLRPGAINWHDGGRVSYGLCQVQARTGFEYGLKNRSDLMHPEKNALIAARILAAHYRRFGNWDQAIQAYNAGPYKLPLRNVKYLRKVKKEWNRLLKLQSLAPLGAIAAS